jgi:ATP-dependent DNA ligase
LLNGRDSREFTRNGLGIVSKKVTSRYVAGRSKTWLKTKALVEGEFVVIGHKRDREPRC